MPRLIWTGVACCLGALMVNMFPREAYEIGIDRNGAWFLFGFGIFLILASLLAVSRSGGGTRRDRMD